MSFSPVHPLSGVYAGVFLFELTCNLALPPSSSNHQFFGPRRTFVVRIPAFSQVTSLDYPFCAVLCRWVPLHLNLSFWVHCHCAAQAPGCQVRGVLLAHLLQVSRSKASWWVTSAVSVPLGHPDLEVPCMVFQGRFQALPILYSECLAAIAYIDSNAILMIVWRQSSAKCNFL